MGVKIGMLRIRLLEEDKVEETRGGIGGKCKMEERERERGREEEKEEQREQVKSRIGRSLKEKAEKMRMVN